MHVRSVGFCLAIGASLAVAGGALARPGQQAPGTVFVIPTFEDGGRGMTRMRAATLDSKSQPAWRDNADLRDKSGKAPAPSPGYILGSAVVIQLADPAVVPDALLGAARASGASLASDPGIPGIVVADSPDPAWTVRSAISFATAARAIGGVAGAFIDMTVPLSQRTLPTDPLFPNEWHLHNTANPLFDVNAEPAWDAGYTGTGVVIGIVDQGWAIAHPDLAAAYDAAASQSGATTDGHATSCAGVAGARAFNGQGVAGIAYDCQLAKLYYGSSNTNASAFSFRNDLNDIKSNSWGPFDNGLISTMPANERSALTTAITTGRDGLGEIFVWAAGNGAAVNDRCDYDPYASSRFTIAVGAIDNLDQRSLYSETGSSLVVVAQSDHDLNSSQDVGIWTTTVATGYTGTFGGTSAACPLAAGAVALMLDANPLLTWRDVQQVLIRTARMCDPSNAGWTTNAAGHHINYNYGFGAVDAGAAAALAATWRTVEPQISQTSNTLTVGMPIPNNTPAGISGSFTFPDDLVVEHVEVRLNIVHPFVGDLRITLTSPGGTESILAAPRSDPTDNYSNYLFTSFRHWDEHSAGTWTINVADTMPSDTGSWTSWSITVYGTTPRCPADYNRDGLFNSQDFFDFLTAFFGGNADFNMDGTTNTQDFFDFCTAFFGGC